MGEEVVSAVETAIVHCMVIVNAIRVGRVPTVLKPPVLYLAMEMVFTIRVLVSAFWDGKVQNVLFHLISAFRKTATEMVFAIRMVTVIVMQASRDCLATKMIVK